ncbi:hypothetical protein TrRE_jg363 [Triparma retinervis]|uniref:Uncharacterized protein n=1 Tax=Triparma retinervis TaxID=2557542 RepID=A0A9W7L4A8_9STRA|nr:hypothetical protein TrRE_jg363 [Triparma retinervis]
MPLPSYGVHRSPVRGLPKTYSPSRVRSNVRGPSTISEEEMNQQISLGEGPVKGADLSSNAPVGNFEVEHEYFVLDVGKMAREHSEKQRVAKELEAQRIKKFRKRLKSRLSTQTKHITKEELARQKAEEKRKLYERKVEVVRRDWSKAAKEPAPRLRSRRESTKIPLDFGLSVVNIEVPAVDWGSGDTSAARGRLLKFKKK